MPNAAPVAYNDGVYSFHPTPTQPTLYVTGSGVLANDTDADLDMLSAYVVSDVSHGSLTLYTDGSFSYTPSNHVGADSFTYYASDMFDNSNTATVSINVTNSAPVATDDWYNVHENQSLYRNEGQGVLANDSDGDQDTLTADIVDYASNGTVTLYSNGSFDYNPPSDWTGTATFTYKVYDGLEYSSTKTVSIFVGNHEPVAYGLTLATKPNTALTDLDILGWYTKDADGDTLSLTFPPGPYPGSLSQNQDGTYTYTPASDWSGTDSFTFTANDGLANSNTGTITIYVGNNTPAIGGNLSYTVYPNASLTLTNLLANAIDTDGDSLSVVIDVEPSHGSLSIDGNGNYVYTADNYTGTDSFTYYVTDGDENSDSVTVSITLTNTAPIIANTVLVQTEMEQEVVIPQASVLANAMSQSSSPSIVSWNDYTPAAHGTVTRDGNGDFHYTPEDDFFGTDSFSYTVYDGTNSVTSLVQIVVQETPLGILNFTPLAGVAGTQQTTFTLRFMVTATRGPVFDVRHDFTNANQQGIEGVVCDYFAQRLTEDGWEFTRNGNRLSITYLRVGNSRFHINAIGIYQYGTLYQQHVPVANRFGGVGEPP